MNSAAEELNQCENDLFMLRRDLAVLQKQWTNQRAYFMRERDADFAQDILDSEPFHKLDQDLKKSRKKIELLTIKFGKLQDKKQKVVREKKEDYNIKILETHLKEVEDAMADEVKRSLFLQHEVTALEGKLGRPMINLTRPFYDHWALFCHQKSEIQQREKKMKANVTYWKKLYNESISKLEQISGEEHEKRMQTRTYDPALG